MTSYIKQGDCLELMKDIPTGSIDMILCDLPYGVLNKSNLNAKWDSVIPLKKHIVINDKVVYEDEYILTELKNSNKSYCYLRDEFNTKAKDGLWEQYKRIIKDNGAIVLFASGMFTSDIMHSNKKWWRYNLIWKKGNRPTGFLNANRQPLRIHEDICVFSKLQTTYNPQMTIGNKCHSRGKAGNAIDRQGRNGCYGEFNQTPTIITNEKYPISIIDFNKEYPQKYHSTQKPIALCEHLIKTYTNEGETILDNCMGSGSTIVAAIKTNRNYIGFERDENCFKIAEKRIADENSLYMQCIQR